MPVYKVELNVTLSAMELSETLVRLFGDSAVQVRPDTDAKSPQNAESHIIQLLSDGKSWKSKNIVESISEWIDPNAVRAALRRLERRRQIRRIRHGTFMLMGANSGHAEALSDLALNAVLSFLDSPRTCSELQMLTRLPRNTVARATTALVAEGRAVRFVRESGEREPIFCRSDVSARVNKYVYHRLDENERVIHAMVAGNFYKTVDVADMAAVPREKINAICDALELGGFLVSFRMGSGRYVALSSSTASHSSTCQEYPSAKAADLLREMGVRRVAFLQVVERLGCARTSDLTRAMRQELFSQGCSAIQAAQSLLKMNLIERVDGVDVRQPRYGLTSIGLMVLSSISRAD